MFENFKLNFLSLLSCSVPKTLPHLIFFQLVSNFQHFSTTNISTTNISTTTFYQGLKAIYGPRINGSAPVLTFDGTRLLTDKNEILSRWAEYFNSALNQESTVNNDITDSLPQHATLDQLDLEPSLSEVTKAIQELSSGMSPGFDGIPGEIYKHGGAHLVRKLTKLFQNVWNQDEVPQEFKDASIVHLYKRKGNKHCCDNHRGISLLSIAAKILARVILNRILHLVDSVYPESQCGFRAGRGTTDMIFASRQTQEKAGDLNQNLYMVFVDLTKAFDTVNRDAFWKVLHKFGCPAMMTQVVSSFHNGMMASLTERGLTSDTVPVNNGTKQGCVMAPVLFEIYFQRC